MSDGVVYWTDEDIRRMQEAAAQRQQFAANMQERDDLRKWHESLKKESVSPESVELEEGPDGVYRPKIGTGIHEIVGPRS